MASFTTVLPSLSLVLALCCVIAPAACAADLPPWRNWTLPLATRVEDLVQRLTLAEALTQMNSNGAPLPRFNITQLDWGTECLHGVKNDGPLGATIFPQPIGLAATFDKDLLFTIGTAISDEGRALNNNVDPTKFLSCWAPNMNIYRDPRWGRGCETYGEDPTLTSEMVKHYVTGVQGNNTRYAKIIGTCKHFAAYSLEEAEGDTRFAFNAVVHADDWTDTYLPAFQACVQDAGVHSIMCSYNAVNGTPSCTNSDMLQGQLRNAWGFDSFVVSDCGAIGFAQTAHHYVKTLPEAAAAGVLAGTDVNCGNGYNALNESLAEGLLKESDVLRAVNRSLAARFLLGQFDPPGMVPYTSIPKSVIGSTAHMDLAREAARESVVLLKNANSRLPLDVSSYKRIAVIGPSADDKQLVLGNYHGNPFGGQDHVVTPLAALQARVGSQVDLEYQQGCWIIGEGTWKFEDAITAAESADLVLMFVGSSSRGSNITFPDLIDTATEKESLDRLHISLPGTQGGLIKAIAKRTSTPIVVVLINGGPQDVSWAHHSDRVDAIVAGWYPGQVGATGLVDVLFGAYNPSGRLPVTFYYENYTSQILMTDMNMRPFPGRTHKYLQVPVLYEFGYGLSYTSFDYGPLSVVRTPSASGMEWTATVTVTNTGTRDGAEAALLFVRWQSPANATATRASFQPYHPPRQALKRFERAHIVAGATHTFTFTLDPRDFMVSDELGTPTLVPGVWAVAACGSGTGPVNHGRNSDPRWDTVSVALGTQTGLAVADMAVINARRDGVVGAPEWGVWPPSTVDGKPLLGHSSSVAHVLVPPVTTP